ncbi:major facilitator superfamily domain-containing protein [Aspergillus nidulans var. acristatus]
MSERKVARLDDSKLHEKHNESFVEHAPPSVIDDEKASRSRGDYSGAVTKTDPKEIKLVRKLDRRVMPIVWAMYFLNYVDRNAIASARLNGLEKHLGLQGTEYNTCISILFVGYLLMQIPSNMLMSSGKVRASVYMSVCMGSWAVVSACTALTKSYSGLVMVRFFLGIAEAPFYPGALFLLSLFYTRKEIALRISILYSGNIVATAMSGLIALATFETLDGSHGLKGWQWLFIIEGVVTFGVAMLGLLMLPDHPLTTRWLTPEERKLAHAQVLAGLKEACRDPRLYLLAFMQNMHLSACSFNNFFPTVIGGLGFNSTITLALTCPPYLVSGAVGVVVGITSGKWNERTWHITVTMGIAVIAFIVSCATMNTAARYLCCFLFTSGAYGVNSVILGWVSATLGQTAEKKAASLSFVNVVANASYIYTAYLYPDPDGPRYIIAMSSNAAFGAATVMSAWALRWWLQATNRKIQRGMLAGGEQGVFYAY